MLFIVSVAGLQQDKNSGFARNYGAPIYDQNNKILVSPRMLVLLTAIQAPNCLGSPGCRKTK